MSRPAWMDRFHEFRENVEDGSMCACGIPATHHDAWERRVLIEENEKLRNVIIDGAVAGYVRDNRPTYADAVSEAHRPGHTPTWEPTGDGQGRVCSLCGYVVCKMVDNACRDEADSKSE